jgi:hypothetical protein
LVMSKWLRKRCDVRNFGDHVNQKSWC